jgi:hypothetical protein
MKKTFSLAAIALTAFTLLNCGKDDPKPGPPTLTVQVEQTLTTDGVFKGVVGSPDFGKLNLHFEGKTPAGFELLTLKRMKGNNNAEIVLSIDNSEITGKNISYDLEYELTGDDVCACNVTFAAELSDTKGNHITIDVVVIIDAHWPLFTDNVIVLSNDNDGGLENGLLYFLSIESLGNNVVTGPEYNTQGVSINNLTSNGGYGNVHLVFNRVLAHHLISPNAANAASYMDKELVSAFPSRKATLVKIASVSALSTESQSVIQNLDEYSALSMIELFDNLTEDASPEMAPFVGDLTGKIVMLKLVDGRVCLIDNMVMMDNLSYKNLTFRFRMVKARVGLQIGG